jgi:hypothetical protein
MPIELTAAQAEAVARLAREIGPVSLHQIADGQDVYVAGIGEPSRYLITSDGDAAPTQDD